MKKSVLFITLYALSFALLAQDYFQAGYLVKSGTDTIRGQVQYQGQTNNCSQFVFRASEGEAKTYTPQLVNAYGFTNGEEYRTELIFTDKNEQSYVFLQLILDGRVSLYVYNDEFYRERIFIEKDSLGIHELRIVEQQVENSIDIFKHKEYIGYLKYYLADSKTPLDIKHTKLSLKEVKELIEKYNAQFETPSKSYPIKMKTDKRESPVIFGIGAGFLYGFNSYSFKGDYPVSISDGYRHFNNPGFFLNLSFKFPFFFQGKFSVNTGFGYQKLNYQVEYNWPLSQSRVIDYNQTNIYIPLNFIYEILKTKVKPYVNAGVVLILNQDEANNNTMSTTGDEYSIVINNDNFSNNISYLLGAGVKYDVGEHFQLDFNFGLSSYFLLYFDVTEYKKSGGHTSVSSSSNTLFNTQISTSFSVHYRF